VYGQWCIPVEDQSDLIGVGGCGVRGMFSGSLVACLSTIIVNLGGCSGGNVQQSLVVGSMMGKLLWRRHSGGLPVVVAICG